MSTPSLAAVVSTQYGAPIGEYRGGVRAAARAVFGNVGAILLTLLIVGLVVAFEVITRSRSFVTMIVLFSILPIAGILFFLWLVFKGRGAHAQLFEQGFVISCGGQTISGRWDDIVSVTQRIMTVLLFVTSYTSYKYTLTLANGETMRVDNSFGDIEELGQAIQQRSAKALLPHATESYQSGASLRFGVISISQAGISNGKETVPWSDIDRVTFGEMTVLGRDSGYRNNNNYVQVTYDALVINRKNQKLLPWLPWVKTPVAKVPNVYVFMSLVDRIQGGTL